VCVYGGNDFSGAMRLQRYFSRRTPPNLKQPFPFARLTEHREQHQGPIAQELSQAGYFLDNPEDVQVAIDTMAALHLELARRCRESDARLLLVYLPPGFATQPETYAELYEAALSDLGLPRTSTEVSDRIADSWLAWALGQGLEVLDLRQAFAGVAEPLFWFADLHLNTRGHELVAETLHPLVERLSD
jgi:hypothetical protein